MNNGKVRIYDLSKDLNLDNKDILAICEDLNIAVKSHSSTISESEAERIRAAAEKNASRPATARRGNSGDRPERRNAGERPKPPGHPSDSNKQQILQIKHKPDSGSNSQESGVMVAIPPQMPEKQLSTAPMKPTTLKRPPLRPADRNALPNVAESEEKNPQAPIQEPIKVSPPAAKAAVAAPIEEKPQLTAPPLRPEDPSTQLSAKTAVVKPLLKKIKSEPGVAAAKITPPAAKPSGEKKQAPTREPSRQESPPLPELQRPQRRVTPAAPTPQRPEFAAKSGEGFVKPKPLGLEAKPGDKSSPTIETLELDLKRPSPPRVVKRGKGWEEEEEDPEVAAKAGKVAPKGKRRSPLIVDDEDDDVASGLDGLEAPVSVSLSVARPPKQKAPVAQPVAAATIKTARRPGAASDRDAQKADKRREQKTVERAEKIVLTRGLSVRELAMAMAVSETEIIKKLFSKGIAVNITQTLDLPTASMVAVEMGVEVETGEVLAAATKVTEMLDAKDMEKLQPRPPVVTIMGHVDHGKTTLLDAIRETKVAQGEAGGITQHIGAYHVDVQHEDKTQQVVFLDTPGHEAFTAMRARGARVTDIAVLVVAADDGVRPQTIEAIRHAQAAEVPIVVAINKIDKAEAQPDRVKQELTEYNLVPEEWGGQSIMVEVSALKGENLDRLLEMILLTAEIEELSANPDRPAKGTVIEAHLDKAKGPVATLLVQNGTLRVGDTIVAGHVLGKVRALVDDRGARVEAASPSFAVEVLGLSDVPAAGDDFDVFENEKEARALASSRFEQQRQSRLQQAMASRRVTLNTLSAQAQEGELKELNLILKADVQGSAEAILGALRQLPQNEVQIRVLLASAGEITETDVDLAAASGAVIIGFNTTLASGSRAAADQAGVDVREYNIIYKLLDDIQGAMEGLLDPEQVEEPLGQIEVRAVFTVGRGAVAGCYVLSGKGVRNCQIRVHRGGKVIYQGVLDSLKRMKDDVKEANAGFECGVGVDRFNDWAVGDIIETFQMVSKRRTLSPA